MITQAAAARLSAWRSERQEQQHGTAGGSHDDAQAVPTADVPGPSSPTVYGTRAATSASSNASGSSDALNLSEEDYELVRPFLAAREGLHSAVHCGYCPHPKDVAAYGASRSPLEVRPLRATSSFAGLTLGGDGATQ